MADADGALGGLDRIHLTREKRAQHTATVHGIGRKQVEESEINIRPDQASQQVAGMDKRLLPELEVRDYAE